MGSYKNFSQAVQRKHKIKSGEISDSTPVKSVSEGQLNSFKRNLDKWEYFTAWCRWYPDLFLDMIHPDEGGIVLDLDQRAVLRATLRFVSVYGVMPRAYGKCNSFCSYLFSNEGMLKLGDLISKDYEYQPTDFDTINRYGEREHTYLGVYNGVKPTLKIDTEHGYNNECTHNHKLMVADANGVLAWKRVDKIEVGDLLCVNRKNGIWGSDTSISATLENTPDFSYDVGRLIGDEDVVQKPVLGSMPANGETASVFMKNECGYDNPQARVVPKFIRKAPKECCKAFLQGIFDAGGTLEDDTVSFTTRSKELGIQIQLMLLNFGIVSKRVGHKGLGCDHWRVSITGRDVALLYQSIGSRLEEVQKQLEQSLSIQHIFDEQYLYTPVVSIEESTAETGDINMPDTNSWVCNGVVSHNTMIEVLSLFLVCMFFPNIEVSMTAQTQANAAKMLKDKYTEIVRFWPTLGDEISGKPSFGKDTAEIRYKNGSIFNVLANNQNSKGQRRKRINIEESALLDAFTFDDALRPIVDFPRFTIGKLAIVNPEEISQRINFFTTAGFRGTDEHTRSLQMIEGMSENDGNFVIGSDWRLAAWYGRGITIEQMRDRRKSMSAISFAQNYMSRWVGASENQLVDAARLLAARNLDKPEFDPEEGFDYVFGIDVARSSKTGNNESCVSIIKIIRKADNTVRSLNLVNMVIIPGTHTFDGQAIEIKRLYNVFKPKMCVVDVNGLGVGLKDVLVKTQTDPSTGEELIGWDTIVEALDNPVIGANRVLYDLYPQSVQSKATVGFMDVVSSGKLRLLVQKDESDLDLFSKDAVLNYVPYKQTDEVVGEILNLKVKYNTNGSLGVEQVVSKIPKDRYTSLSYGIWWILEFDNTPDTEDGTMSDFFARVNQGTHSGSSPEYLIKKIFR